MLTISESQLANSNQISEEGFVRKLCDLTFQLRPELRDRVPNDQFLFDSCSAVVSSARGCGFATEFEIAVYFAATLFLGRGFENDPTNPFSEIITRPDVDGQLKANQLLFELNRFLKLKQDGIQPST